MFFCRLRRESRLAVAQLLEGSILMADRAMPVRL